jgi:hypothetical protein
MLVETLEAKYAAMDELRAGSPQHAEILRADYEQRIAVPPAREAEIVRADIGSSLNAHPHVADALAEQPAGAMTPGGKEPADIP